MVSQASVLGLLTISLETLFGKMNREIKADNKTSIPQIWKMRMIWKLKD